MDQEQRSGEQGRPGRLFPTHLYDAHGGARTKTRLVKAMVFPVVMYGCESWTAKKAEHQRIDAFNCGVEEDS